MTQPNQLGFKSETARISNAVTPIVVLLDQLLAHLELRRFHEGLPRHPPPWRGVRGAEGIRLPQREQPFGPHQASLKNPHKLFYFREGPKKSGVIMGNAVSNNIVSRSTITD